MKTLMTLVVCLLAVGPVFAAGEIDVTYGSKGRVVLEANTTVGEVDAVEGNSILHIVGNDCENKMCNLHAFELDREGKPFMNFNKTGSAVIPLNGTLWPKHVGPLAYVNRIVPGHSGEMRLVMHTLDSYYDNLVGLDYYGKPIPGAINIGGQIADTMFFDDGTFLTASNSALGTSLSAHQTNGETLNSFGSGGYVHFQGPELYSTTLTKVQDKIRVSSFGRPAMGSSHLKMVQIDQRGNFDLSFGISGSIEYTLDPIEQIVSAEVDAKGRSTVYTAPPGCRSCNEYRIWRFTKDGDIDDAFGDRGFVWLANVLTKDEYLRFSPVTDKESRILMQIYTEKDENFLIRLNEAGELDKTFGHNGHISLSGYAKRIVVEDDGKYLVVGQTDKTLWVERYLP